jgi:hypothetical protein
MSITHSMTLESARRRVIIILVVTAACLLTAGITLYSQVRDTRHLNRELADIKTDLTSRRLRYAHHSLAGQHADADEHNRRLKEKKEQLRLRIDTFRGSFPKHSCFETSEDARIDFKVALFKARSSLQETAAAQGVKLTNDLGIAETIGSKEDAETRLWELASVVRLVELLIGTGVHAIESIDSLPPIEHGQVPADNERILAFPVRLEVRCTFAQLQVLLNTLQEEHSFYTISQCDIGRPAPSSKQLRVRITCSALRFVVGTASLHAAATTDNPGVAGRTASRRTGGNQ